MKRRLFNILSAMSLVLCVATMVLWILNIWAVMMWVYCGDGAGPYIAVASYHGRMEVDYETLLSSRTKPQTGLSERPASSIHDSPWTYFGFDVQLKDPRPASDSGRAIAPWPSQFVVPDWFICSITAVLPFRWYRSYRRRRLAARKGLCPKCGYDLRASKDRCPECGTPIPVQTASSRQT